MSALAGFLADAGICSDYLSERSFTRMLKAIQKARTSRSALHYRRLGQWLTALKRRMPHGLWLPWLARVYCLTGISRSCAANYMRLAGLPYREAEQLSLIQAWRKLGI